MVRLLGWEAYTEREVRRSATGKGPGRRHSLKCQAIPPTCAALGPELICLLRGMGLTAAPPAGRSKDWGEREGWWKALGGGARAKLSPPHTFLRTK